MKGMFSKSVFNGYISNWNVENVTNMDSMFNTSKFKGNISKWKPFKVLDSISITEKSKSNYPYWARFIDRTSLVQAINMYHLYDKINNKLPEKNVIIKKNRI